MAEAIARQQFDMNTSNGSHRDDVRATAIQTALNLTGYAELRRLQIECEAGAVTISGRVPTYYLKQLAHCVIQEIPGINRIHNEIDVC